MEKSKLSNTNVIPVVNTTGLVNTSLDNNKQIEDELLKKKQLQKERQDKIIREQNNTTTSDKQYGFYITAALFGFLSFLMCINTNQKKSKKYIAIRNLLIIGTVAFFLAAILSKGDTKPESTINPSTYEPTINHTTYEPTINPTTYEPTINPSTYENPEQFNYYNNINNINNYRKQYYNNIY